MVWPALWEMACSRDPKRVLNQFGVSEGYLCIGCLEARIGRRLNADDFTGALVNDPHPWNTPRLDAALARRAPAAARRTQRRRYVRRMHP